jgi:hypothetical protein
LNIQRRFGWRFDIDLTRPFEGRDPEDLREQLELLCGPRVTPSGITGARRKITMEWQGKTYKVRVRNFSALQYDDGGTTRSTARLEVIQV